MVRSNVESTWTLIVFRVCTYRILSNRMTKNEYISKEYHKNIKFYYNKRHKNRARSKI